MRRGFVQPTGWSVVLLVGGMVRCAEPDAAGARSTPAALVEVAPVRRGTLAQTWSLTGEVRSEARSQLAVGAEGAVRDVTVHVGDRITRGQRLLSVDPRLVQAQLAVARAEATRSRVLADQAATELKRFEQLRAGLVPEVELDRARATLAERRAQAEAARAAVVEAEARLARHSVVSPFDGVVLDRRVDPGTWVATGDVVLEVASTEGVDVFVDAPQALLDHVGVGTRARSRDGWLEVVGLVPVLDPVRRTARVRLLPADESTQLQAGGALTLAFDVEVKDPDAWLVPRDALAVSPDEVRIVLVEQGQAQVRTVKVVARGEQEALVRCDALDRDSRVVVRGNERLRPGQPLRVASEGGGR
jgi:RND family efflux transporter MFP subunit